MDRTTILGGPALITWDSAVIYSEGDIELTASLETNERGSSIYGKMDEMVAGASVDISFTPCQITETGLAKLWPYLSTTVGTRLFGATDKVLTIQTVDGKLITFHSAALTQMPSLNLNSKSNLVGPVKFSALHKNSAEWSDANSLYTVAASAWTTPGTLLDIKTMFNGLFSASWAASGAWANFVTEDGFSIDFDAKFSNISTDAHGLVNVMFSGLDVLCKCKPIANTATALAEAELLEGLPLQGSGTGLGKSLNGLANAHDLTITNDEAAAQTPKQKLTVVLKKAAMKTSGMRFGQEVLRNGEVGWVSTRQVTGGVLDPLVTIALS